MSKQKSATSSNGISRRTLMKSGTVAGLTLAAGGFSLPFSRHAVAETVDTAVQPAPQDKVVLG